MNKNLNIDQIKSVKAIKDQPGHVISTPTQGTNNLLLVQSGKILVFVPNK
jgi:hypothetical protein